MPRSEDLGRKKLNNKLWSAMEIVSGQIDNSKIYRHVIIIIINSNRAQKKNC